jgi:hypothetical protein
MVAISSQFKMIEKEIIQKINKKNKNSKDWL